MNVTELARKLKITPNKLFEVMPQLGFDIGRKAIKIDPKMANDIFEKLSRPDIREKFLDTDSGQEEKIVKIELAQQNAGEKVIKIPSKITVKQLAAKMLMSTASLILELMKNGIMASINQDIDYETAAIIAEDMGFKTELAQSTEEVSEEEILVFDKGDNVGQPRPPVIVVMGHVDHGKTKLLDAIRQTNIAKGEAGGITQQIGAYQVEKDGRLLTFIDTPGHEAFSAMRSRGARVADVAILVVAADDGVQPQTIEALSHIHRAELPFIVAINKIDKLEANIDRVKGDLAKIGLTAEDWGGKTICVNVSAKEGTNIGELIDNLFLVTDVNNDKIQADSKRTAAGTIIESNIDKGEGPVATVLIQAGTLKRGEYVKIGDTLSRIRTMKNWKGEIINEASPSTPVRILGLKSVPRVGDILRVVNDKKEWKQIVRKKIHSVSGFAEQQSMEENKEGGENNDDRQKMSIILKTDVLGMREAIIESVDKIKVPEVRVEIINQGLGNINEKDIEQAYRSEAYILGFNVKLPLEAKKAAVERQVNIQCFNVIYDLIDFVEDEIKKRISQKVVRMLLGKIKILAVFKTEKKKQIVGGEVVEGKIVAQTAAKIIRGDKIIGEIMVIGVEAGKMKVKEVVRGEKCGLEVEGNIMVEQNDLLEIFG